MILPGPVNASLLVAGATGLVGRAALGRFAGHAAFTPVRALVRRPPAAGTLPSGVEAHVVDYDRLDADPAAFAVTHVLCALGTTMQLAGSREAFRRVDHDYALAVARLGARHGARHFLLVSALGADAGSRIFYNRVKGEVEAAARALPYRSVTIVRPSLLLGERAEVRLGERIAARLAWLVPSAYKPVHADQVAEALLRCALEDRPGVRVVESKEIREMAGG